MKAEELYHLYKQDIYHYLLSLTHNPNLAEDLLSETFLKAIYALSTFQGRSSVKTWLFAIARNTWLGHLRKKGIELTYDELFQEYVRDGIEEEVIQRQVIQRIEALLQEKDERTRRVIEMRMNGYPYGEISQALGISESSARVIDFRVKKWIREQLEREGLI